MRSLILRRLGRDSRGVSVVEFALMAPIFAFVVMGISDLARAYAQKLTLEQAAHRALELVAVGTVQSDYSYLQAEAATAAGVPQANVSVDQWLECDGTRQAAFDGQCTGTAQTSRYVKVTVTGSYTPSFNYAKIGRSIFTTTNGSVTLSASSSLRVQ